MVAVNGWVMGPAIKFTDPQFRIYQRRALISWGDCVKINYDHKTTQLAGDYVEAMAKLFNGLRIDNAHSTDKEVLRYCIQRARRANPDLLILCEVFTGSATSDSEFVQNVGADMRVVEVGNNARNCDALCAFPTIYSVNQGQNVIGDFEPLEHKAVVRSSPVLIFDQSHDNKPNGATDSHNGIGNNLALAGLITACEGTASGTTWGVDMGITTHLEVSNQTKCYREFDKFTMTAARRELLDLKEYMATHNFTKVYAENHGRWCSVERQNPDTFESLVFVIAPDYREEFEEKISMKCEGKYDELVCGYKMRQESAVTEYEDQTLRDVFAKMDIEEISVTARPEDVNSFTVEATLRPGMLFVFRKRIDSIVNYLSSLPSTKAKFQEEFFAFNIIQ